MQLFRWFLSALAVVAALGFSQGGRAADLPAPAGTPILTVGGNIANTNAGDKAEFDLAALDAIGITKIRTSNPFVQGVQVFEGVLLSELLKTVGADGDTMTVRALDGYQIDIPLSDANDYPVILASRRNGEVMTVRNKGPLWVIYPVDQFDELNNEQYSGRSVWQVEEITIR